MGTAPPIQQDPYTVVHMVARVFWYCGSRFPVRTLKYDALSLWITSTSTPAPPCASPLGLSPGPPQPDIISNDAAAISSFVRVFIFSRLSRLRQGPRVPVQGCNEANQDTYQTEYNIYEIQQIQNAVFVRVKKSNPFSNLRGVSRPPARGRRDQPTKFVNVRSQFAPRMPAVSSSS